MRKKEIITPYTLKNSFYMEACNIFKTPIGLLTDESPYGAFDIELSANDNDATTLAFSLMGDSPKLSWLVNENLVLMDGEYYIIKKISMEDGGISIYRFECEHEICSYKEKFNSKIDLVGKSPEELITAVCTNTTDRLPIRFGGTDIRNKYRHLQSEEVSVFANLVTIAEVFNARLKFINIQGIIHVWLLANPKDKGRFIEKKRDLDKVNLEYDSTEMYTRLHYFGGTDDVGNEITMHSENPTGKSYIEDFSYWINQGYTLEDVKANPNCIKEMTIRNAELTTSKQVYEMALQEMEIICRPKLNATVSLIDLQMYKCYNLEPIEIGDLVRVYDKTKNLHLEATIVGINKNGNNPLDISINLSNVIEINSALKDLVGTSQVVDKITNGGNMVQGTYVKIGSSSLDVELFEYNKKILGNTTQINENKASIEANAEEIALKVNESEYISDKETINDRITNTELKLEPGTITATVTEHKTFTNKVGTIADEETKKQLDAYKKTVDKEFEDVTNAIKKAEDYVDGAFKDGILTEAEKEGIKVQINQIDVEEKDIAKQYTAIYNHSLLINKATLKQAYDGYIKADNDLTSFLNSMLLLTNIEIGHVTEKDRLFTMYKEKLGAVKDRINLALDEIALNRTNNLESNVESRFATLEIDLDGVTTTVGKHTETINTNTQQITSNKTLAQQQADKAKADAIKHANDLKTALDTEIKDVSTSLGNLNDEMNGAFKDGIVSEAEGKAIKERLVQLEKEKADLDSQYNSSYNNADLKGSFKTNLLNAKNDLNTKYASLKKAITDGIADKHITSSEIALIDTKTTEYSTSLATFQVRSIEAIDSIAKAKADNAQSNANEFTTTQVKTVTDKVAEIKVESDKISQTVSSVKEQVVVIDGQVKDKITLEQANSAIEQKADEINLSVNNKVIGGVNQFSPTTPIRALVGNLSWEKQGYKGCYGYKITGQEGGLVSFRLPEVIKSNGWWTISFLAQSNGNFDMVVDVCDGERKTLSIYKEVNYYSISVYVDNYSSIYNFIDFANMPHVYLWLDKMMIEKGTIAHDFVECGDYNNNRLDSAEQQITPSSIVQKVETAMENGNGVNTTKMTLDKDGIITEHGGYKTVNSNGWMTCIAPDGSWNYNIGQTMDVYLGWIAGTQDYIGGLRCSTRKDIPGSKIMSLLYDADTTYMSFGYTVGGNGSADDAYSKMKIFPGNGGKVEALTNFDFNNFDLSKLSINYKDRTNHSWINETVVIENSLNTNYPSSNLILNWLKGDSATGSTPRVYVQEGRGNSNRGIIYVSSVDSLKATTQTTETSRGIKKSLGVTAMKDFIEDVFFGVIGENGTSTIAFNQDFLLQADTSVKYHVQATGYDGGTFKIERFEDRIKLTGAVGEEFSLAIKCFTKNQLSAHAIPTARDTMKDEKYAHNQLETMYNKKLYGDENSRENALKNMVEKRKGRKIKILNTIANGRNYNEQ